MVTQDAGAVQQTETQPDTQTGFAPISDLARYREAQEAKRSSAAPSIQPPAPPAQPDREAFIPRERFDEVNTARQHAEQQALQYRQHLETMQQQQAQPQTQQQNQQPQTPASPDFNNPEVEKEWLKKMQNNPVKGMRELIELVVQERGSPLLEQTLQQVQQYVAPVREAHRMQMVNQYATTKATDPTFTSIRPAFENLVGQAEQRGIALNAQTLPMIEAMARQMAPSMQQPQYQAPAPPFTERPGGSGTGVQQQAVQLTAQQRDVARRFNMSDAQYAESLSKMRRG